MLDHDRRVIHSSEESDWRTPPACFGVLDLEFCFTIDAAADAQNHLVALWFGPDSPLHVADALTEDWNVHADEYGTMVFLNPPFSRTKAKAWTGLKEWNPYRIENWARKCWEESRKGCTIVGLFPFAPQTGWYRKYVYGHNTDSDSGWSGHAAQQERRLPHRISFLRPDGSPAGNAGVNTAIIVWSPMRGVVGPWQPHSFYWSYR